MKNFLRIAQNVQVMPLLLELHRQPELWNRNPARLAEYGPHRESSDIWLRYKDETKHKERGDYSHFADEHHPIWYPAYYALPAARPIIFNLMTGLNGESLGGVLIYKIPAGKRVYPHIDKGWHVDYHDRFNVYLQTDPRVVWRYPDTGEEFRAQTGDIYSVMNNIMHEVVNEGDVDNIVMTVCIHLDKGGRSCLSHTQD